VAAREDGIVLMQLIPNPLIIPVGLLIGVLVAAPVGPVNVLCIHRAIQRGFWGGVAAGLGAVLGDGLIAFLAALGVGAISGTIEHYRDAFQFMGGLALIAFGAKLSVTAPRAEAVHPDHGQQSLLREHLWDVPKTFFLTLTNPGAVLGLIAIVGGASSFVEVHSTIDALTLVASIICGSLAWWGLLSSLIGRMRHTFDVRRLQQISQISGLLLFGFGGMLVADLVLHVADASP
jgi:threonine/homoserine/homoserine lactone efflux protein